MEPSLIDINVNQKGSDNDVPILRQRKFLALLYAFLFPTLKLKNQVKDNLLAGVTYPAWLSITNYNLGDRVTVGRISYECIVPNINNNVTNTTYWYQINDDNIGLTEKLNYDCKKMQLEYILNKRWNILNGNILPPYDAGHANIYIVTNPVNPFIAWRGANNAQSSWVKNQQATKFYYHTQGNPTFNLYNFTIYVPNYIITNIGLNPIDGYNLIRQEVDKYNAAGMLYNITHY